MNQIKKERPSEIEAMKKRMKRQEMKVDIALFIAIAFVIAVMVVLLLSTYQTFGEDENTHVQNLEGEENGVHIIRHNLPMVPIIMDGNKPDTRKAMRDIREPINLSMSEIESVEVMEDISLEEFIDIEEEYAVEAVSMDRSKPIYDIPLSTDLQWFTYDLCIDYGVPFDIAIATVYTETGGTFNDSLVHYNTNGSVDKGLFQINECNYESMRNLLGDQFDPLDPYYNIEAGVYFIMTAKEHSSEPSTYMMVYNQGAGGAKRSWDKGTYSTAYTRKLVDYAQNILPELQLQVIPEGLHY